MQLEGSCHCGNVKWHFPTFPESVTACNCSLCRRYGALWIYGHIEDGVRATGKTNIYRRKIHAYHFCVNCGCLAYNVAHAPNEEGRTRIVVNLRMVENPADVAHLPIDHFDGLDTFEDMPRDGRTVRDLWY